jgi:Eco57I restriction-modification methylase
MDLRQSLLSIESIVDLPRLVATLGHAPGWEAVPEENWNRSGSRAFRVTAVGQTGSLPWLAIESRSPLPEAMRLARRLSRWGKPAIVLALNQPTRRLGISIAFGRCPGIELDLARPDLESIASVGRLAAREEASAFAFSAQAAEALSSEPAGRRFFREFKSTLDRMTAALPGPHGSSERHSIVLLQLTRVLFLYFIQSKGWLAGRERFLSEEVDGCLSRHRRIHRDFLRPLFFGTLNQPPADRSRIARRFGAIPFLNGGLFEPHPLERRFPADIPNPLWREAFDCLFERFHFTVSEGSGAGTVAPDMLGRVFEGVMAPEDRRASGTFYTPAALVNQLVGAALAVHLSVKLGCTEAEAERRLESRDPIVAGLLGGITVLDPAVGSGAFLLGALDRLSAAGHKGTVAARKREVLQQSLFGVDRNAAAVRLTELRLWLSVIAEESADAMHTVVPLPNLDCLIRQGDSLFDPPGLDVLRGSESVDGVLGYDLSSLRRAVITTSGPDKRRMTRRLRILEERALEHSFRAAEQRHMAIISEYLHQARAPDLFGQQRGLDRELEGCLKKARLALRSLRQARRRLADEGEISWFHYQSAFADVFSRGGFDLVIGNPPWLRSEAIPGVTRTRLRERYSWFRGGRNSYGNAPDLAVAFLERAFELAGPDGVVAMLVPFKIASAGYSAAARHALASSTTLHVLANLTGTKEAAFEATVYPLALIGRKSAPPNNQLVRTSLTHSTRTLLPQSSLRGGGSWILSQRKMAAAVVADLVHRYPALSEAVTCHLGVKTGLNRAFLNPPAAIERQLIRWAVRGRDVKPFCCRSRTRLLWTHDARGNPAAQLPPEAQEYLNQYEAELRSRRDFTSGPWWTVFRARPSTAPYRVIWSDLARQLTAAALTGRRDVRRVPLNSCYVAPVSSARQAHALTAWLNSTWIRAVATIGAVPASGGFSRFNARIVNQLPLPHPVLIDPALCELGRAARAGAPVQQALDELVGEHLELSIGARKALRAALGSGSPRHR